MIGETTRLEREATVEVQVCDATRFKLLPFWAEIATSDTRRRPHHLDTTVAMLALLGIAAAFNAPPILFTPPTIVTRAPSPRLELGFQFDPAATASSVFVLGGFTALQLKIKGAEAKREERDEAIETYRKAEVLLLAGKLSPEEVARVREDALAVVQEHEDARRIGLIAGALLRIPDPTRERMQRVLDKTQDALRPEPPSPPPPATTPPVQQRQPDGLDGVRNALGLARTNAAADDANSLLPTGSSSITVKDIAIGLALVAQIGWFLLSLTDPLGAPNPVLNAALSSGGDYVDQREAKRAAESAEYRQMLLDAVANGEAPPTCATRSLSDGPSGGCAGDKMAQKADEEFARTRGLDANREFIIGPPPSSSASGF